MIGLNGKGKAMILMIGARGGDTKQAVPLKISLYIKARVSIRISAENADAEPRLRNSAVVTNLHICCILPM
jgi:hypothetical protein